MKIDIPREIQYSQTNKGDFSGVISYTRNISFDKTYKTFFPSPRVLPIVDSVSNSELTEVPVAFARNAGTVGSVGSTRFWALEDNYLFQGGMWGMTRDDGSTGVPMNTDVDQTYSDMVSFNGRLYIAGDNYLYKRTSATYTEISSALSGGRKLLAGYSNRLYIVDDDTTVVSMSTAEAVATTGTYTLNIDTGSNENLAITCIRSSNSGLWLGTMDIKSGRAKVFFWDGVTENVANSYKVDTTAVLSLVIKDDIPYIITAEGILMAFNGSFFEEVGRLPIENTLLYRYSSWSNNDKWIHPNGTLVIGEEIYMLVNSRTGAGVDPQDQKPQLSSGIYAYNKDIGIYHKYALSSSIGSDTGDGTYKDYGQLELKQVGALYPLAKSDSDDDYRDQSEFFVGYSFASNLTTEVFAIGSCDINQTEHSLNIPNAGVLVTNKIQSEEALEQFESLWLQFKPINSTDKIVLKYRTQEYTPAESNITWVNTTSFTTTDTDFATIKTNFEAGVDYEVEVLQGDGAGMCSHITNITYANPTYTVTVDTVHTGATTNTAKARIDRWAKVETITDSTGSKNYHRLSIDKPSTWIQYKIFLLGVHNNPTIERIISKSQKNVPV